MTILRLKVNMRKKLKSERYRQRKELREIKKMYESNKDIQSKLQLHTIKIDELMKRVDFLYE